MAIALNQSLSTTAYQASGTTHTVSFDAGTGSDRYLVVSIMTNDDNTKDVVSGVTYAGVSMTRVKKYETTNQNVTFYHYVLHNHATGTNNIVVSLSQTSDSGVDAQSYTGVYQDSSIDSSNTATATGNVTCSVTTTADNCWLHSIARNQDYYGEMNAGTGTTRRDTTSGAGASVGDSNGAKTPAGSHSMQWTVPTQQGTSFVSMIAFAPAVASSSIKTINGLALSSVKTVNGLAIASVKTVNGLS